MNPPLSPAVRIRHAWGEADLAQIHAFLSRSYWAEGMPLDLLRRAMQGSMNFLLVDDSAPASEQLCGYARVITDRATYAYLCDVFVLPACRGRGWGRQLIAAVMQHPELQGLRRMQLVTRDAHGLYAPFGFTALAHPERAMEIARPGLYLPPQD
ncbi:GNAT family N-acetyltransferase [Roseateles sp. BYS180W]|uniref:GNAT family N-acetyltransferase n=1 Tax=Roseateles rivi TaxID=3299028 RepID=A0ABW7FQV3_9BURK